MRSSVVRRRLGVLAASALLAVAAAGCTSKPKPPPPTKPKSTATAAPDKANLLFGVFGTADETVGFTRMVDNFNSLSDTISVRVKRWDDQQAAVADIENGRMVPDVFLTSRRDLAGLDELGLIQPVDALLDARGVDFGDEYARDSLTAFSADLSLKCMPYGISPMVIYYNRDLIDFAKMRERGLDAPQLDDEGLPARNWTFDQFVAAAQFGTKPARGTRGVHIASTLRGIAPFVISGGGVIFDDDKAPTSLTLADDGSVDALATLLSVMRDGAVNLTPSQLDRRTPLEWFKRGKVAMIAGFRDLVPELRALGTLNFDVMPMPVLDGRATIGDITGMCISSKSKARGAAADFLTYLISADSVEAVAREGYLVPANVTAAASESFLQPRRQPANSRVFAQSVRDIYIPPMLDSWDALEAAAKPGLDELTTVTVLDRDTIAAIAADIDAASAPILTSQEPSPTTSTTP